LVQVEDIRLKSIVFAKNSVAMISGESQSLVMAAVEGLSRTLAPWHHGEMEILTQGSLPVKIKLERPVL
jgi:hypothetical protein